MTLSGIEEYSLRSIAVLGCNTHSQITVGNVTLPKVYILAIVGLPTSPQLRTNIVNVEEPIENKETEIPSFLIAFCLHKSAFIQRKRNALGRVSCLSKA